MLTLQMLSYILVGPSFHCRRHNSVERSVSETDMTAITDPAPSPWGTTDNCLTRARHKLAGS